FILKTLFSTRGSIESNPKPGRYPVNTPVVLTAKPEDGFAFVEWTGNASGTTNPLSFLLSSNTTVGARFEHIWNFVVNEGTGGTVASRPSQNSFVDGTAVSLSATPAPGFASAGWRGTISSTANPLTLNVFTNTYI